MSRNALTGMLYPPFLTFGGLFVCVGGSRESLIQRVQSVEMLIAGN